MRMRTVFWQGRELANKTASGIYRAIVQSFTSKPMDELDDDPSLALTELDFFSRLKDSVSGDPFTTLQLTHKKASE